MQAIKQIFKENVNVNQTDRNNVKRYNVNAKQVERIANYIADKLHDQKSVSYFCKVAWKIPEHQLMNILEMSMRGHSPQKLFTYLCNLELKKLQ